ncbi:MAG: alpha/beta fold hydrolase [Oscillospiraceae bacterium]
MKLFFKSKKLWLLVAALVIIFLILPMALTAHLYNDVFGVRVDVTDNYYDYIKEKRPGFIREGVKFSSNRGQQLQGYFYRYAAEDYKGLVVMAHGMGGGQDSYIAEAQYLATNGYLVFCYDNTGTNESEGKALIGLSQSTIDLDYAISFVESITELGRFPLVLYGHSWGGFAVTSVGNFDHRVKGIVSVAGFEKNSNVLKQQGRKLLGDFVGVFMPYVNLYERILFGANARYTGTNGLENSTAKVLIIQSEDDQIVDYNENFMAYKNAFADNDRFTFLSIPDHGHNAVLSPRANFSIQQLRKQMEALGEDTQSDEYRKLKSEEFSLILDLDREIMDSIVGFYDSVCIPPPAAN